MDALFYFSFLTIAYAYFGLFALVFLLSRIFRNPVQKAPVEPKVSLVIAAYNEERVIREKLENSLALDYPKDKLEIVVVTDGSSDRTPDVAKEYENRGVRVLHHPERRGKTAALCRVAPLVGGEILFFSDANTHYRPDTVRMLVRNFADPAVGGASGRKIIRAEEGRDATAGETGFWSYESWLKKFETDIGSISTADGEIFAMRKNLFEDVPRGVVHDDMYLTLVIVRKGFRVVYEWDALSEEAASKSFKDEFFLKTRYASAGYQILRLFPDLFLPPRTYFAFQFLSHKLLRWLAPVFLITLFISSLLSSSPIPRLFGWMQIFFYAVGALGFILMRFGINAGPLYFPAYFCLGNGAALYGIFKLFKGGQSTLWRKAER